MALTRPATGWAPLVARVLGDLADARATELVGRYLDEVLVWNARTDLTAARSAEELVDLSLSDAAVLARASHDGTPAEGGAWIDVGSGAGAPGLVLAILLPGARMTLVEPRDRRVSFLRSTIGKLNLTRTVVERGRSDRLPDAGWDTAVSRATLPPPEWLKEGARLARGAVWVLLARDEPPTLPGHVADRDVRYEWPLTAASRRAVRYVPTGAS